MENYTEMIILQMHCKDCASKGKRRAKTCNGVKSVKVDKASNRLTIVGYFNASVLQHYLKDECHHKEPETVSIQQSSKQASTVVLKVRIDCMGCIRRVKNAILKVEGVVEIKNVNAEEDLVTVAGVMNVDLLSSYLERSLKRRVEIVSKITGGSSGEADSGGDRAIIGGSDCADAIGGGMKDNAGGGKPKETEGGSGEKKMEKLGGGVRQNKEEGGAGGEKKKEKVGGGVGEKKDERDYGCEEEECSGGGGGEMKEKGGAGSEKMKQRVGFVGGEKKEEGGTNGEKKKEKHGGSGEMKEAGREGGVAYGRNNEFPGSGGGVGGVVAGRNISALAGRSGSVGNRTGDQGVGGHGYKMEEEGGNSDEKEEGGEGGVAYGRSTPFPRRSINGGNKAGGGGGGGGGGVVAGRNSSALAGRSGSVGNRTGDGVLGGRDNKMEEGGSSDEKEEGGERGVTYSKNTSFPHKSVGGGSKDSGGGGGARGGSVITGRNSNTLAGRSGSVDKRTVDGGVGGRGYKMEGGSSDEKEEEGESGLAYEKNTAFPRGSVYSGNKPSGRGGGGGVVAGRNSSAFSGKSSAVGNRTGDGGARGHGYKMEEDEGSSDEKEEGGEGGVTYGRNTTFPRGSVGSGNKANGGGGGGVVVVRNSSALASRIDIVDNRMGDGGVDGRGYKMEEEGGSSDEKEEEGSSDEEDGNDGGEKKEVGGGGEKKEKESGGSREKKDEGDTISENKKVRAGGRGGEKKEETGGDKKRMGRGDGTEREEEECADDEKEKWGSGGKEVRGMKEEAAKVVAKMRLAPPVVMETNKMDFHRLNNSRVEMAQSRSSSASRSPMPAPLRDARGGSIGQRHSRQ